MIDQNEFFNQAKAQMDKWQAEMKDLQTTAMAKGQEQFKQQLDTMNTQRKEAEKQLEALGKANTSAVKEMQDGVGKAWKEMEKSMEAVRKQFD